MNLTKQQSGQRWAELRQMVIEWDPLGLIGSGAPNDEYDCLLADIFRQLQSSCDSKKLAKDLGSHISEHFGLAADRKEALRFADKACSWYKHHWLGSIV